MTASCATVPLAHANQLPVPRLSSAAVYESSHVSSARGGTVLLNLLVCVCESVTVVTSSVTVDESPSVADVC